MGIKKLFKDVRGAALIYVIVASALIILLGAATTATAYVNLRATQVQENSDNNFYNADAIMNAIVGGLKSDISLAYEVAYTNTLMSAPSMEETDVDGVKMVVKTFKKDFVNAIYAVLSDEDNSSRWYYDLDHIKKYVEQTHPGDLRYTISAVNGNNYLDVTETGVILRNLHITYENDSGYFDEITTDIEIDATGYIEIIEKSGGLTPYEFESNIVIDDGLEINFGKQLTITGDTYINERESDKSAILLNGASSLTVKSPNVLVAGGFVKLLENTSLDFRSDNDVIKNKIWTEDIDIGIGSTVNISGVIYVTDDLEVNGSYSEVYLAGDYYGYSKSSSSADNSSAININGAHTLLDIEKLDSLLLAGSSYIATSTVNSGSDYDNTQDIQTGEALSVKSNQIAYFVDDKEFSQNDIKLFISNPMSTAQYETMVTVNGGWAAVESKLLNKKLSYGKTYAELGVKDIIQVFSGKDGGTVYLYLGFDDPDAAAKFFVTAYTGNSLLSQRLRTYAAQYITSLNLSSETDLLVNENFISQSTQLYTEDNLLTILNGLGYNEASPNQSSMNSILTTINTQYFGNNERTGDGQKYEKLYEKIIIQEKLEEFIDYATNIAYTDHHTNNEISLTENGVIINGTSGAKAILVDNAGGEPYELGSGKGVVIVSGDLHITGDWLGTIIVGGRAYCTEASCNLITDLSVTKSVLDLYITMADGDKEVYMMIANIFKMSENAMVVPASTESKDDVVSESIKFTNWNRY